MRPINEGARIRLTDPARYDPRLHPHLYENADQIGEVLGRYPNGDYQILLAKQECTVTPDEIAEITTVAYQYGLLDPLDWDTDCHEQLFRMNRFWNQLVEVERTHRAAYRTLMSSVPDVAPIEARATELATEQTQLRAERKRLRQTARAKIATPEITDRLRHLATELQVARAEAKEAKAAAKLHMAAPIKALSDARFEAAKKARQNSQLYWGNYNAVFRSYEAARSRAMKDGTELRFRPFRGEGRFVVQIMNGCTPDELACGTKPARLNLTPLPVPHRGGKPRPQLQMTIYTVDRHARLLTWPIIYDRPLPQGYCRIQEVVVTRRKVGTRWRFAVVFTCRVDATAVPSDNPDVCGINLGFRVTSQGLRIATLYTGREWRRLHVPDWWMNLMDRVETLVQQRDKARNEIHAALKTHWPDRPAGIPDTFDERLTNLIKAPTFACASLAFVALKWREHAHWWPKMFQRVEAWRALDKRRLEAEASLRSNLILTRREQYRLFARDLAQRFGLIRIGDLPLQQFARLESAEGVENELHHRARRNRTRASLYLLQMEIEKQAAKFGVRIEYLQGPFTITCHACGGRCATSPDMMHVCEHCHAVWDQDENASRNIFAATGERSNDEGIPGSART